MYEAKSLNSDDEIVDYDSYYDYELLITSIEHLETFEWIINCSYRLPQNIFAYYILRTVN
jgi:hypothetical protein